MQNKKVGEVIRIEYNQETKQLNVVIEITDPIFKSKILSSREYADLINLLGKDAIVVASKTLE